MSFDFGGTFSASQFERFRDYARNQVAQVDQRIAHLKAERDRVGNLSFAYDAGGVPTKHSSDTPTTYCGKLFAAYEALGGNAEYDLQVRAATQPIYRIPGDTTRPAQLMSNGEVISALGLGDAPSSVTMQKLRSFVSGDLHRRRDYLERKIRRALDYAEQLDAEIAKLTMMKAKAETEESLEYLIKYIEDLAADKRYLAVTDDSKNPDPHGKLARAPVAPYTPDENGPRSAGYERSIEGFVTPAQ